jgi:hypothetical protein
LPSGPRVLPETARMTPRLRMEVGLAMGQAMPRVGWTAAGLEGAAGAAAGAVA